MDAVVQYATIPSAAVLISRTTEAAPRSSKQFPTAANRGRQDTHLPAAAEIDTTQTHTAACASVLREKLKARLGQSLDSATSKPRPMFMQNSSKSLLQLPYWVEGLGYAACQGATTEGLPGPSSSPPGDHWAQRIHSDPADKLRGPGDTTCVGSIDEQWPRLIRAHWDPQLASSHDQQSSILSKVRRSYKRFQSPRAVNLQPFSIVSSIPHNPTATERQTKAAAAEQGAIAVKSAPRGRSTSASICARLGTRYQRLHASLKL